MKSTIPLLCLTLAWLLATPLPARASTVGVDERLGETVALEGLTFRDEAGEPIELASLADRPLALSLVFFRCHGVCSPLLHDLGKATDASGLVPGKDMRMVSVSFDPGDTPDLAVTKQKTQLARMTKTQPPPEAWRFLTGDQAAIDRLTRAVGFNYEPAPGGGFNHAGVVVFLSRDGKICRYLHGSQFNPLDVRMAVEDAAAGAPRSFIRTLSQLCFAFDPVGRTYVLKVNRIILGFTVLFASCFGLYLLVQSRRGRRALAGALPAGRDG